MIRGSPIRRGREKSPFHLKESRYRQGNITLRFTFWLLDGWALESLDLSDPESYLKKRDPLAMN